MSRKRASKRFRPCASTMVENKEENSASGPKSSAVLSKNFRDVTHEDNERRIRASIKVLQGVRGNQSQDEAKQTVLKRLIRGTGASMTNSKIGFYTLLAGYLKECQDSVSFADIFALMDNELKVTNQAKTRETADAYVGRTLIITAMIRQNMLHSATVEDLRKCVQMVVDTTKLKSYHSKLAYNALISLIQSEISEKQIQLALLPVLRSDLKLTWKEHSMSSVHFLIELKGKFPKLVNDKFLNESFSFADPLNAESFEEVYRIFWLEQNESSIMQPSYEALAKYIAKSPNQGKFCKFLSAKLEGGSSRNREVITVKVMTEVLNNLAAGEAATKLISPKLWEIVFQSARKIKATDEILRAVYLEFFEAIYNVIAKGDKVLQLKMIRTLMVHPGTINVDKFSVTNRIISRSINVLDAEVLCQLLGLIQKIITDEEPKGGNSASQWLYSEKVTALGYLQKIMHNKKVNLDEKTKTLNWLANFGLFENSDTTVNPELAEQIKRLFFKTLESPFIKINEEKKLLLELVAAIDKRKAKGAMRQPLDKPNGKLWSEVVKEAQKKESSDNLIMFHVLLLHMALQLFNDPELAANAIKELYSCMERATTTSQRRKNKRMLEEGEPEWTEVIVDLILHLLSQNSTILRNVVKKVFPNICGQLNLSAIHQILSLLDMTDENPLEQSSAENGNGEEEELDEEENEESEGDSDEDEEEEGEGGGSDDDDDDDDDDEDIEDHDATLSDQLKNAVSMVLMNGGPNKDDDQDSIDLDTMTEEEGQRLDEALSNAFKLMGKGGSGKRKSKTEKLESTALLHFRNRVIDLLIIYMKSTSPELVVVLEIVSVLYRMLEDYSEDDAAEVALFKKVQEAIDVAVATKLPAEVTTLSMAELVTYLRTVIGKSANPLGGEERSVALQKIVRFFTQIEAHLAPNKRTATDGDLSSVLDEELKSFLTQRSPALGLNIFQNVLQGNWQGIRSQLGVIVEHGLVAENRVFKRVQSLDLLRSFQKNNRFIKAAPEVAEDLEKIHNCLEGYLGEVAEKVTQKELKSYLQLLLDVKVFHNKNPAIKCHLNWAKMEAIVKSTRERIPLDNAGQSVYAHLCKMLSWTVVKGNAAPAVNGHAKMDTTEGEEGKEKADKEKSGKKRKAHSNLKEKKLKKEKRMKLASQGIDESAQAIFDT